MTIDPYILTFSAITVIVTIWMGFRSAKTSKTASDFFVAGRSVSVGWNASAISGEYLSAASFMGVAGMVMSSGYDALWYPVCYACGYLFLLLFIAGPLRRFGAYTIPDFAEGRFDSPLFRKIAVVFVLFIGFFYTMPQMKGAGTTLAYIFPGLPYWAGVVLVGAVITLNVALGGMKGITLVQAFQYWAKMFAISVPIFVLMSVYGHYGKQLGLNRNTQRSTLNVQPLTNATASVWNARTAKLETRSFTNLAAVVLLKGLAGIDASGAPSSDHGATEQEVTEWRANHSSDAKPLEHNLKSVPIQDFITSYSVFSRRRVKFDKQVEGCPDKFSFDTKSVATSSGVIAAYNRLLEEKGIFPVEINAVEVALLGKDSLEVLSPAQKPLSDSTPASDSAVLQRLKTAKVYGGDVTAPKSAPGIVFQSAKKLEFRRAVQAAFGQEPRDSRNLLTGNSDSVLQTLAFFTGWKVVSADSWPRFSIDVVPDPKYPLPNVVVPRGDAILAILDGVERAGGRLLQLDDGRILIAKDREFDQYLRAANELGWISSTRKPLPEKAPADSTWLNPFGPLTTKAAKAAKPLTTYDGPLLRNRFGSAIGHSFQRLFEKISGGQNFTFDPEKAYSFSPTNRSAFELVLTSTMERQFTRRISEIRYSPELTNLFISWPSETRLIKAKDFPREMHPVLKSSGVTVVDEGEVVSAFLTKDAKIVPINPKPYSLLYTYSLIIALVCGTAGLPHILVRFYTNPDGVAAKRTTMWVMILIGVFYVFPPVFGVMGRNLLPSLYEGVGAKGTDKVVLELPRILNDSSTPDSQSTILNSQSPAAGSTNAALRNASVKKSGIPWGSILSGITCAGAFAAFMSTFSGLLVSMTGAMAHDVYGRMLNPKATPEQRLRAFKIAAVVIGGVAILLGSQVEPLEINFMVGQAFAIAAASYFPLLFMAVWWRKLTMKGAATGMLTGGLSALIGISLTSFSTLAVAPGRTGELFALFKPLNDFWAAHPLLRILCEQPAIWAVPLAIALMVVVSKLTSKDVPEDIRMKMLVLHAPEKLGLKQEYIQEHQQGGH